MCWSDEPPAERVAAAELAGESAWSDPLVMRVARLALREALRVAVPAVGLTLEVAYLEACLRAVQSLPYHADGAVDCLRDPSETIAEGGDCEDLASLFVALVTCGRRALGLRGVGALVVWIDQSPDAPQDHVSAWCWVDGAIAGRAPSSGVISRLTDPPSGVWWAETTVRARRGESPYAAVERLGVDHDRIG